MSNQLRDIRKFSDLLKYLEAELEWPVEQNSFDDLTFEYVPAELGLKDEDAVKVKKIHQLRPLATGQPWGVFFVEFEKKKLPVVVLRRILSHLVIKKRASANKSDRAAWNPNDLLFISAFGDEASDAREIAFAHFHQQDGDLPTLQVLGWDGGDTVLKLDHVAGELREKLHWPANPKDHTAWRTQWSRAFRHKLGHTVRTADDLAEVLAALARGIRERCSALMRAESDRGPLTKLFTAFQAALIHDLTPESFADTYAQTITYGLFTAAVNRTDLSGGTEATFVKADDMTLMARSTSPFLKEMLETFLHVGGRKNGVDFDELGIQDVVELLRGDETDLPAILRDFGNRTRGEDPVIHFYEHFLSAYNKKLKIQRGVFYTPQPVVSYIVRSVHELLQTEFGLEDGLASTVTWGEMIGRAALPRRQGEGEKAAQQRGPTELKLPPLSDEPGDARTISPDEPFVQILDPATGTATFLVETVDVIHKHLEAKWKKGGLKAMPKLSLAPTGGEGRGEGAQPSTINSQPSTFTAYWNEYVPRALLPRLHGYELLAAPYAIAHLKLGLKLTETGYRFGSAERARIYLTNALEPKVKQLPQIGFEPLAHEAQAVNEIKWYKRFTVVIGNPPYSNFGQLNKIPSILNLLEDYKRGLDERKINLDDDFIKFIRFSQHLLDSTKTGLFGMITNNVFIDGITHRRMRESIKTSFNDVRILDLHGSSKKLEASPDGATEENVFDIQQGVGISLFIKSKSDAKSVVKHSELWGNRESKYEALRQTDACRQKWVSIECVAPHFFYVPKKFDGLEEYNQQPCVAGEVFVERNAGIQTKRDGIVYHFTKGELDNTLDDVRSMTAQSLTTKYELPDDGRDWAIQWAKTDVRKGDGKVIKVAYHPFDSRWTLFTGRTKGFMAYPRTPLMWSALQPNRLLLTVRNPRRGNVDSFFVAGGAVDKDSVSPFDNVTFFPLYVYPDTRDSQASLGLQAERHANFNASFLKSLRTKLDLPAHGQDGLPDGVTPEDIFHYAYAVFHSPGYRSRYAEFLKIDFPRLPLTGKLELFRALARLGGELTALHLLEAPLFDSVGDDVRSLKSNPGKESQRLVTSSPTLPKVEYLGGRAPEVEKVSWSANTVWLDKAQTTGFKGVREDVWNFHIGGYQVCEKWLKDRKGRTLSAADREHYQKIVVALSETIRLMAEIDVVIEKHGGWPMK